MMCIHVSLLFFFLVSLRFYAVSITPRMCHEEKWKAVGSAQPTQVARSIKRAFKGNLLHSLVFLGHLESMIELGKFQDYSSAFEAVGKKVRRCVCLCVCFDCVEFSSLMRCWCLVPGTVFAPIWGGVGENRCGPVKPS